MVASTRVTHQTDSLTSATASGRSMPVALHSRWMVSFMALTDQLSAEIARELATGIFAVPDDPACG